jgi:hypothetical protein
LLFIANIAAMTGRYRPPPTAKGSRQARPADGLAFYAAPKPLADRLEKNADSIFVT